MGNVAVASGTWTWSGVPLGNLQGEPHTDTGRYTMVLEKRGGKWMIVAEHYSEAPHDKKVLEAQVLKMGQEYVRLIKNKDVVAIEKMLADEYQYTDKDGKIKNKAEDLASYQENRGKLEMFEIADQKANVLGNNSAVETGIVRFKGIDKDGKPFEGSERYTTTWVWRNGRWQIAADHTSEIKK